MISFLNKKVLVVDDSQTMRLFILFNLIKLLPGVKIMEAEHGADAVEKLKQHDMDLILTDMNMPEMDGLGLVTAIRQELKKDTPIIVITTKSEQALRDQCLALGANGYITKPLNIRQFRETVLTHLV